MSNPLYKDLLSSELWQLHDLLGKLNLDAIQNANTGTYPAMTGNLVGGLRWSINVELEARNLGGPDCNHTICRESDECQVLHEVYLISSGAGIYQAQEWAEDYGWQWSGMRENTIAILCSGPQEETYDEAWANALDFARLYKDGEVWSLAHLYEGAPDLYMVLLKADNPQPREEECITWHIVQLFDTELAEEHGYLACTTRQLKEAVEHYGWKVLRMTRWNAHTWRAVLNVAGSSVFPRLYEAVTHDLWDGDDFPNEVVVMEETT